MNRNIILGIDWLKQSGFRMYYDLGCIIIVKSYVKMKEDINISPMASLTAHNNKTVNGKICPSIANDSEHLLNSKFHQVYSH